MRKSARAMIFTIFAGGCLLSGGCPDAISDGLTGGLQSGLSSAIQLVIESIVGVFLPGTA